jgi:hypothetical protein
LRQCEIPVLAKSGAKLEHQIGLHELRVSVVDGRVHLFVPRLGKQVFPRLTSAHNTSLRPVSVYRFGISSMDWRGSVPGVELGPCDEYELSAPSAIRPNNSLPPVVAPSSRRTQGRGTTDTS